MEKISVVLILVCLVLIPVVTASQDSIGTTKSDMRDLPELDMTGLETDIELIEVDPEIIMATDDWMILAHDNAGKKSLIEDIDRFSLSDDERSEMKFAVNDLWATYPTKFVPYGEKTIEIIIQSEGSEKIISVPVGHVTKIEFDRTKIKENAQGKENLHAQMLASIKSSTKIALTENENQTIRNISGLREKLYKQHDSQGSRTSEEEQPLSVPSNSFSGLNGYSSGLSSSSSFSINQGFPSSVKLDSGSSKYGLAAWSGSPEPLKGEDVTRFHNDPALYTGHNGIMFLSCNKMGCAQVYSLNAADTAMDPDSWEPLPETCQINMAPFASIILPIVAEEKWKLLIHSCNHYYDPLVGDNGSGAAPVYVKKYSDMAKYNKTINDVESAKQLGQASHFLTDVSLPTHTGTELPQVFERISEYPRDTHNWYEFYLNDLWNNPSQYKFPISQKTIKQIIEGDSEYYSFTDPEAATKNLARFSNSYSFTLFYKIRNLPVQLDGNTAISGTGFYADMTVERITKNQVLAAARYTNGLVRYVRNDTTKNIPIADFTVSPNPVCNKPYDVMFHEKTHLTQSGSYSYEWNFGDGYTRTSGDYDFPHRFASSGVFTVTYKTWNTVNGPQNPTIKTMDVYAGACPPSADFYIYPQTSLEPYSFKFEDHSSDGTPTSWMWSFGDDSPGSSEQNPIHKFDTVRPYDVTLIVSNQYGDSILTKRVDIIMPNSFAILGYDKKTGYKPLTVTFTDESSCWATSSEFDAGDGTPHYYNLTEFVHTYQNPGTFFANLTVRNDLGTNTNTTTITVISSSPLANFTATPHSGPAPLTVRFTDTSTSLPNNWLWNFGDGNTTNATKQNPVHTYWSRGSFTVSLTATNAGGSNTTMKVRYIRVTNATDIGVYRSGQWILDYNIDGTVDRRVNYGVANDTPVVGDFNNDGRTDIGVYRSGQWILDYGIDGTVDRRINYGTASDSPFVGDFNNDGTTDIGVYRSGQWILDYGIDGTVDRRINYGTASDSPFVGDFNNDGTTDIGVFRSGQWTLDYGIDGTVDRQFNYGMASDIPVVGDFNNDGRTDTGVFRSGQWILDYSIDGTVDRRFNYGIATDIPIVGDFNN